MAWDGMGFWVNGRHHRKTGRARNKCGTRFKWFWKPLSFFDFLCLMPFYIALFCYVVNGGYEMWVALVRVTIFLRLERQAKALGRLRQVGASTHSRTQPSIHPSTHTLPVCVRRWLVRPPARSLARSLTGRLALSRVHAMQRS